MSDKYQNKYRIPSARLQHWDYRWPAAYFITTCTQNREHYFGEIKNGKMILSGAGILADVFWHHIKQHTNGIELGEFVVMPNHVHGILILQGSANNGYNENKNVDGIVNANVGVDADANPDVETRHALSLQTKQQPKQQLKPQSESQPYSQTHSKPGLQPESLPKSQSPQNFDSRSTSEPSSPSNLPSSLQPQSNQQLPSKTIGQQRFQNQGKNSLSSLIGSYKSAVTKHANRLQFPFAWQPRFHEHVIRDAEEYRRISNYIQSNIANWMQDKFYG